MTIFLHIAKLFILETIEKKISESEGQDNQNNLTTQATHFFGMSRNLQLSSEKRELLAQLKRCITDYPGKKQSAPAVKSLTDSSTEFSDETNNLMDSLDNYIENHSQKDLLIKCELVEILKEYLGKISDKSRDQNYSPGTTESKIQMLISFLESYYHESKRLKLTDHPYNPDPNTPINALNLLLLSCSNHIARTIYDTPKENDTVKRIISNPVVNPINPFLADLNEKITEKLTLLWDIKNYTSEAKNADDLINKAASSFIHDLHIYYDYLTQIKYGTMLSLGQFFCGYKHEFKQELNLAIVILNEKNQKYCYEITEPLDEANNQTNTSSNKNNFLNEIEQENAQVKNVSLENKTGPDKNTLNI